MQYFIDDSRQIRRRHNALIAFPLSIITILCFGFVLMHGPKIPQASTTIASTPSQLAGSAQSALSPLSVSNTQLPQLSTMPVTPASGAVAGTNTGTPQLSNATMANLQSASPNNQTVSVGDGNSLPEIITPKPTSTSPTKNTDKKTNDKAKDTKQKKK